jgi:hypothetical protein
MKAINMKNDLYHNSQVRYLLFQIFQHNEVYCILREEVQAHILDQARIHMFDTNRCYVGVFRLAMALF